jgi:hypothetical protein
MSRKDLSTRQYLIKQDGARGLISYNGRMIHDGGMPLNEIYWNWMKSVDDKCINMIKLRYIEYVELINTNIRPFKKD